MKVSAIAAALLAGAFVSVSAQVQPWDSSWDREKKEEIMSFLLEGIRATGDLYPDLEARSFVGIVNDLRDPQALFGSDSDDNRADLIGFCVEYLDYYFSRGDLIPAERTLHGGIAEAITVFLIGHIDELSAAMATRVPASEAYRSEVPILEWFEGIGELRGSSADRVRTTYIIEPALGYDGDNQALANELVQQRTQIVGTITDYFKQHLADDVEGAANKTRVKNELVAAINLLLTKGRIEDIVFRSYQFLPY